MEKRHAAAAGRAEQESYIVLLRQLRQLRPVGRHKGFVGCDHMLSRRQRRGHVAEGRLNAAHDLSHCAHRRVVDYFLNFCYFKGTVVLPRTDKDRALFKPVSSVKHSVNSHTHSAEAQKRYLHVFLQNVCPLKKDTCIFDVDSVS